MRELDRINNTTAPAPATESLPQEEHPSRPQLITVIGNGRAGSVLAATFRAAGIAVDGPLGRDESPRPDSDVVLICTPDSSIAEVAASISPGPALGHCCGAHGTEILSEAAQRFCLHPLMTITPASTPDDLQGAWAAIDGTDDAMLDLAEFLATVCGMTSVQINSADRAAYHAAASVASNFLITLEATAEQIAASAGLPREALLPLIQASLNNWSTLGATEALTGPVARGDHATVARQRASIEDRCPELLSLFDALCAATDELARSRAVA